MYEIESFYEKHRLKCQLGMPGTSRAEGGAKKESRQDKKQCNGCSGWYHHRDIRKHQINANCGTTEGDHCCDGCNKAYSSKNFLFWHKVDSMAKGQPCGEEPDLTDKPRCSGFQNVYFRYGLLRAHQKKYGCGQIQGRWKCGGCGAGFGQEENRTAHQRKRGCGTPPENKPLTMCRYCEENMKDESALKQHQDTCGTSAGAQVATAAEAPAEEQAGPAPGAPLVGEPVADSIVDLPAKYEHMKACVGFLIEVGQVEMALGTMEAFMNTPISNVHFIPTYLHYLHYLP
ncbi:hypothetical protein FA13DRAFT_1784522 [Coprinellus micaceus]|uniref:C2H2-type domain-containing protein n=1 Tax=Coprinellus micaceus TaxID=71717 RepID=A0A4Y7U0U2_COPMI|nr:hypothetical protein FA13DRAFT_1784522 [Coprinellus micaceus]